MKNCVFCEECREKTPYTVTEKVMKGSIKGESYEFSGKKTTCDRCSSLVFVSELNDENLESLYKVYREKRGLISLEKVREIPDKYKIGKRPLSVLLGWGELTFSRYYDGDVPSLEYSNTLKRIYEDPLYFSELLEKNKDKLSSQKSYDKSRRALAALIGANAKKSKIYSAISYLLHRHGDITPLALQKALYYIQGFYFAFFDAFLFEEDCEAWVHGPVYREVYETYRRYQFNPIEGRLPLNENLFSREESEVLDAVIRHICCYSGKILEEFTHQEMPWSSTREGLGADDPSNRPIPKAKIGAFFKGVKEEYAMKSPGDIKSYAKTMFERI